MEWRPTNPNADYLPHTDFDDPTPPGRNAPDTPDNAESATSVSPVAACEASGSADPCNPLCTYC